MITNLTHLNEDGEANMVDISAKGVVHREAIASGKIFLSKKTIELVKTNMLKKGDVIATARIAAINGAKKTSELIPLCHNILINKIDVSFSIEENYINITSKTICDAKTGIEMEAITAVSVAAITIYDMCKAVDKNMEISEIKLIKKTKGKRQV
jgi:cyclic pyranopterin phosphate synthase